MQPVRVLITGGAGLIGSHIADLLVDEGNHEIVVLDNFVRGSGGTSPTRWKGRRHCVEGTSRIGLCSIGSSRGSTSSITRLRIRITHCAADPRLAMDTMVDGTFSLLEAAVRHKVGRVVAASSASVYGLAESFPRRRRIIPTTIAPYGAAKAFNEGLLRSFHDSTLSYVALRYFNVYGPRMDVHGAYTEVLVRWLERIAAGQPTLSMGMARTHGLRARE